MHVWFAIKYMSFQNCLKELILMPNQKSGILKKAVKVSGTCDLNEMCASNVEYEHCTHNMFSGWFICVTENIHAYDEIITVLGCCTM